MLVTYSYDAFARMSGIKWTPTTYKQGEVIPFILEEGESDQLIASCRSKRMRAYLQCLKETYADPGEALGIEWIDISGNIITINHPVKGHLPRQLEVSNRLLSMLGNLLKSFDPSLPNDLHCDGRLFPKITKESSENTAEPSITQDKPKHVPSLGRHDDRTQHQRQRTNSQETPRPQENREHNEIHRHDPVQG